MRNDSGSTICCWLCPDGTQRVLTSSSLGMCLWKPLIWLISPQSKNHWSIVTAYSWIHCPFTFNFYWGYSTADSGRVQIHWKHYVQQWLVWKKTSEPIFAKPTSPWIHAYMECWNSITSGSQPSSRFTRPLFSLALLSVCETMDTLQETSEATGTLPNLQPPGQS